VIVIDYIAFMWCFLSLSVSYTSAVCQLFIVTTFDLTCLLIFLLLAGHWSSAWHGWHRTDGPCCRELQSCLWSEL